MAPGKCHWRVVFVLTAILTCAGRGWAGEPSATSPEEMDRLVRQLGDANYEVRERAQTALAKLGFEAFDALNAAEKNPDLEIATRAKYLLRLMETNLTTQEDPPEVAARLRDFSLLPVREQTSRMQKLASLPEAKGIPALCRIVRFDRSAIRSKRAALAILRLPAMDDAARVKLAALLREQLQGSRRAASEWLLLYSRLWDDPRQALADWKEWVEKEKAALARKEGDTDAAIVAEMVSLQIQWICRWGKDADEVAAAMRTLLRLPSAVRPASGPMLVDWLVDQKAWDVLKQDPGDFARQFATDPKMLLYRLAKAFEMAGKGELAQTAAQKAFEVDFGGHANLPALHARTGYLLQREGLFRWAEREYREVTSSTVLSAPYVLFAYSQLTEMLHDQEDDLRASEVYKELCERLNKESVGNEQVTNELKKTFGARREFLMACHWAAKGDRTKQRQCLDQALAIDPAEVDTLIASYHLPDAAPEDREKIRDLIRKAVARMRMQALTEPDNATTYNQMAWLISNTEGDYDEAIRFSRKSIQLQPANNGGYYDTLARCHFAKGDYAKAVEYQAKAAELEPHVAQIARQLELFRKTYQEKTGKPAPSVKTPSTKNSPPGAPVNPDGDENVDLNLEIEEDLIPLGD